jgi:hypothetical protein
MIEIEGSGSKSISQGDGLADTGPHQNFVDLQNWPQSISNANSCKNEPISANLSPVCHTLPIRYRIWIRYGNKLLQQGHLRSVSVYQYAHRTVSGRHQSVNLKVPIPGTCLFTDFFYCIPVPYSVLR